jgi:hypothetical protein
MVGLVYITTDEEDNLSRQRVPTKEDLYTGLFLQRQEELTIFTNLIFRGFALGIVITSGNISS